MQPNLLEWGAPAVAAPKAAMPWTEADHDRLTELYVETGGDIRAIAPTWAEASPPSGRRPATSALPSMTMT